MIYLLPLSMEAFTYLLFGFYESKSYSATGKLISSLIHFLCLSPTLSLPNSEQKRNNSTELTESVKSMSPQGDKCLSQTVSNSGQMPESNRSSIRMVGLFPIKMN